MLCDICHNKKARIYYTEIINGEKKEQHLCEECAAECTSFTVKNVNGKEMVLGDILSGLLENYAKGMELKTSKELLCNRCGMRASEFLKKGKLGCPECYDAFRPILDKNFNTIQGAGTHIGKNPKSRAVLRPGKAASEKMTDTESLTADGNQKIAEKPSKEDIIASLKEQLQEAVKQEDYEKAARLRDEIKEKRKEIDYVP